MVLWLCPNLDLADPQRSLVQLLWNRHDLGTLHRALFRTGSLWSCCGSVVGLLYNESIQSKVEHSIIFRLYLILVNLLALLSTGALQFGGVAFLFTFRIFQGIAAGIFMQVVPAYIGELTPK